MAQSTAFAYRLSQTENGWSWRVIDRDGNTIEAGVAPDKVRARAAIRRVRVRGAAGMSITANSPSAPQWDEAGGPEATGERRRKLRATRRGNWRDAKRLIRALVGQTRSTF